MIILTHYDFVNFSEASLEFDPLVADCMYRKQSLVLDIAPDMVSISVGNADKGQGGSSRFEAAFSFDLLAPVEGSKGVCMLLPLLLPLVRMIIPPCEIFSLRLHKRSIADFFMRNYFYAICRSGAAQPHVVSGAAHEHPFSIDIAKRYLWILRSYLDEDVLHEQTVFDMLILNSRLPILTFDSALLSKGAEQLRMSANSTKSVDPFNIEAFASIRNSVIELLP